MSTKYNCSDRNPPWYSDSDITGTGVIINYVATSGIALLIIIVYYFTTYEPTHDPFSKDSPPFLPVSIPTCLPGKSSGRGAAKIWSSHFQKDLWDSGFAQFPSGLSVYYWQVIVDLAWFSSLTHLSCLTILRGYLYHHASEREWRLFSMGILATLLVVGLVFTGNYNWALQMTHSVPSITEYAICYLHVIPSQGLGAFITMVASVLLIILAFTSRVVKLHRTLSVGIFGRARAFLSSYTRGRLLLVFNWCSNGSPRSLKRTLCYYPVFAAFLQFRFFLDFWASMLLEPTRWGLQESSPDGNSSDWSLGQLIALVLLVASLITLVEFFNDSEPRG
ncbi:hypothetical protein N7454_000012 [Penicillium verhagenii]|nr:hypothetical protein N7454_000012 [Penicillium verhagenii]